MPKSVFYYCICAGPHCCQSFKINGIKKKTSLCHLSKFHLYSVAFSGAMAMLLSGI